MDDKLIKKIEAIIIKILKKEGGASGLKPLKKALEKIDKPKGFSLTKTLSRMKNVKKHKNSDYILVPINENKINKKDILNIIKQSMDDMKNPSVLTEHLYDVENLFDIAVNNPIGNEIHLYPHLAKHIKPKNSNTYISIKEKLQRRTLLPTINYIKGYPSKELREWTLKNNFKIDINSKNTLYKNTTNKPTPLEEIANLFDILVLSENAYGHATLTSQGQYGSRFTKTGRPPGIWEQTKEDEEKLANLENELADKYQEMETAIYQAGEHIKGGGPVTDSYADPIEKLEKEIRALKGESSDKPYTEVVLSRLAGPNDAKEYDNEKHQLIIYPGLGSLQYKSRSSQEIVFTHIEGQPAFVRAFGMTRSYDELKKVLPELGQMGDSSYSGFMNVGVDDEPILMNSGTAIEMIKAMVKGKEAEAGAQSAFYTREPGKGGTGVDEGNGYDGYFDGYPGGWDAKPDEKFSGEPFPQVGEEIEEQETQSGQPNQAAAKGTGQAAKKGPKPPKQKKHPHDPDDLKDGQIEMLEMQRDNMKIDIYNAKQNLRYQKQMKSTAPPEQQGDMAKQIAAGAKQSKQLKKSLKDLNKQIATMKKPTKTTKEGFIKNSAKSLLNQYEQERGGSNLREHMKSHKKTARRQILMEGAMKKFFEYFDEGYTNEEVVQMYAQKGVSVPENFCEKARKQYEGLKKLKLELETSEQAFKNVSKMMVNNATEEGMGSEKTLASGLTDY